ncbi:hypothetical protein BYT27DRAFT_7208136 [Phlegmacium glaucopus]|nr:hypothetical protein BYT27DRAFT_7208136 [Phlegmacium glaucopus]
MIEDAQMGALQQDQQDIRRSVEKPSKGSSVLIPLGHFLFAMVQSNKPATVSSQEIWKEKLKSSDLESRIVWMGGWHWSLVMPKFGSEPAQEPRTERTEPSVQVQFSSVQGSWTIGPVLGSHISMILRTGRPTQCFGFRSLKNPTTINADNTVSTPTMLTTLKPHQQRQQLPTGGVILHTGITTTGTDDNVEHHDDEHRYYLGRQTTNNERQQ